MFSPPKTKQKRIANKKFGMYVQLIVWSIIKETGRSQQNSFTSDPLEFSVHPLPENLNAIT